MGTFKETIGKGAYVVIQVKYGLIKLLSTTADLCEQIKEVDLECPLEAGQTKITKEVELPKQIPPVCPFDALRWGTRQLIYTRENTPLLLMCSPRMIGRSPVSPPQYSLRAPSGLLSWYKSLPPSLGAGGIGKSHTGNGQTCFAYPAATTTTTMTGLHFTIQTDS